LLRGIRLYGYLQAMKPVPVPRDYDSLKALIVARAAQLPRRMTQVAGYALENPDEIAFGTVASIAGNAGVQPSAMVRFSQALGYDGFSDLQEVFRERLRDRVLNYDERIAHLREHAGSRSKSTLIFDGFSEAAQNSIHALRERLDSKLLEQAVDILAKADTIYVIGLHRMYAVSAYIAYAWGKLEVKNVLVEGRGTLGLSSTNFATKRDCVLAVSFAPYASETAQLTDSVAKRNVPVVAITDSALSPLAPLSRVWLEVREADFEGFRSLAATLALAMTLTVAVAERRGKRS
jgi:DNA-binding MurR/RpiR family transcriptional regulator